MKFYGKTLRFKRGITLQISLLYPCNLACEYCTLDMPTGKRPISKQSTLEDWKFYIKNFPVKIKEVFVSGGEPTMIKWLPELLEWLLAEKYHVTVFTNLFNPKMLKVKPNFRYQIIATYHHSDNQERFDKAYKELEGYRVDVQEIGSKKLPYSKVIPFTNNEELQSKLFRVSPDLQLYTSCYEHYYNKSR